MLLKRLLQMLKKVMLGEKKRGFHYLKEVEDKIKGGDNNDRGSKRK